MEGWYSRTALFMERTGPVPELSGESTMRMQPCCKKMLWFLAAIAVWFFPAGCKHSRRNQSPQELAEGYYWYDTVHGKVIAPAGPGASMSESE